MVLEKMMIYLSIYAPLPQGKFVFLLSLRNISKMFDPREYSNANHAEPEIVLHTIIPQSILFRKSLFKKRYGTGNVLQLFIAISYISSLDFFFQ